MMEVAHQAARSRANVLIEGESGTGKGVLAEYLHRTSDQVQGLFVKINCTAPFPRTSSRPSCSVTSRAPLPAP